MTLRNIVRVSLVLTMAGLAVAGCGRKGDLEVPGAPVSLSSTPSATATATTGNSKKKQKPVVEDRPFLLDPLL